MRKRERRFSPLARRNSVSPSFPTSRLTRVEIHTLDSLLLDCPGGIPETFVLISMIDPATRMILSADLVDRHRLFAALVAISRRSPNWNGEI
jgi:hypothetical protein